MDSKKIGRGLSIASNFVILLGLMFVYIYKTFEFGVSPLSPKLVVFLPYVTAVAVAFFAGRLVIELRGKVNLFLRILFLIIEMGVVLYLITLSAPMTWPYFLLSALIISATFSLGKNYGTVVLAIGGIITFGLPLMKGVNTFLQDRFLELWMIYAAEAFIWYLATLIDEQININTSIMEEQSRTNEKLQEANGQIESNFIEAKELNKNLEEANKRLEETNQRLNKNVAVFYTLQQVSRAIATILDINELMQFVNDMILGVMGVNYSTILLQNKDNNRLKVKMTNIVSEEELNTFKENIECEALRMVVKGGQPILENNSDENRFPFTKGREIHSMICIPLSSKNETYGVILVEQKRAEAFEDEHLKLLTVIANQVSVAFENVGLYEKMQKMATTDGLTKIYNRLYFHEALSKEMGKADQERYPLCVSIFDIDHFKKFNDTYGHLFGDLVLKTISKLAKDSIREQDIIARFGGEEFVILMPNTDMKQAYEIVEAIREKISKHHVKDASTSASVTASFGLACYPNHGATEAEILSAADTALYEAKESGRNRVVTFKDNN